ncbi:HEAT repeat domain-containing protein [Bacillus sp. NP157]|nr:HEAT repeat domain-containing protein [Bacillus sp. NP157]
MMQDKSPPVRATLDQGVIDAWQRALADYSRKGGWVYAIAMLLVLVCGRGMASEASDDAVRRFQALPSPTSADLYGIARLGEAAHDAGPAVMRLLDSDDRRTRATAAFTLGIIHYLPAEPRLVQALRDPLDPWLNSKAAVALGRLGDPRALEALRDISATHWRSSVRVDATQAIRHIRDRSPYPAMDLDDVLDRGAMGNSLTECTDDPYEYDRGRPEEVRLAVPGGHLVGFDHGEFGGNLRFDASSGAVDPILQKNIIKLTSLGTRTIALTGLMHMGIAEGAVYDVSRDAAGHWQATLWRGLDGPPTWSEKDKAGNLHIGLPTYTVLLSVDGTMKELGCETPASVAASRKQGN